jgi:uracil-DNA glycosylase
VAYPNLVQDFVGDDVQRHSPRLNLINPHHDPLLARRFASKKTKLDYLHDLSRDSTIQFVGSHWWHSGGLYKETEKPFSDEPTCPFDARLKRLQLKEKYQFSNCAMGYIPRSETANKAFTTPQIKYLRPKKFDEYRVMGTQIVFALGQTVLDFHLYGTSVRFTRHCQAIKHGKLTLPCGLIVIPMPHPGALGVMNYLRSIGSGNLKQEAQDAVFIDLVKRGLTTEAAAVDA